MRQVIIEHGCEAMLILSPFSVRYFTGFEGQEGALLVTAEGEGAEDSLLCDSRYHLQARSQAKGCRVVLFKKMLETLRMLLNEARVSVLLVEAGAISWKEAKKLEAELSGVRLVPYDKELSALRVCKGPEEITALKAAVQVAEDAFREVIRKVAPGMTERELAREFLCTMLEMGAESASFDTIVLFGERTAMPHGLPGDRRLADGDLVLVDFGASVSGYRSDETVTFVFGDPDREQEKVHAIVLEAQKRAINAIRPGVKLADIDRAARELIDEAGYGDNFGHSLGHGVGLAVHEEPAVSPSSTSVAEEGMVFTVEPAIYIDGWGGIRLEDMILVTEDGCDRLTSLPKNSVAMSDLLEN